jgi:shikimate kinase
MRPLVLSGGPAVGKSTCGRKLAEGRERAAFIDVDDIRQLVVAGDAALWSGPEGERQNSLAALNTSALARNLSSDGFDVVIADFVTHESLTVYRSQLPDCLVIHLAIAFDEAARRATTRPVYITDDEFVLLHERMENPPDADVVLHVDGLSVDEQTRAIAARWAAL